MCKSRFQHLISVCLLSLLLVFSITEKAVSEDAVAVVKSHIRSFVREIHSVEFEAVATWNAKYRIVNETIKFEEKMKYFQSGNRHRSATSSVFTSSVGNGDNISDWVVIYNGERFQIFRSEEGDEELREWSGIWSTTTPARGMSPITRIFSWLAKKDRPHAWSDITSDENIDDIFKHARYVGNRTFNNIECIVLEFKGTHPGVPNLSHEVWFSLENDCLPVKIVFSLNGSTIVNVELKKLHEVLLDNGAKLFIPVEVVSVDSYPRSDFISSVDTIIVDASTIKINHEIDDVLFAQPTTRKHKYHAGQVGEEDVLFVSATNTVEWRYPSRYIIIAIIISIVFCGLIVYYLFLRRARWRNVR